MVLDALFGVGPPPPRCTRPSTSDVFTALAIVQGDCTSRDALIVRSSFSMPPLASDRRVVAVLSPSTLDVCIPLSPSCKVNVQVARCARCALMVLDALLWHQATAAAVLSPSTSDVYTAHPPSCRVISLVEMRCLRSRCLKPFFRRWTVLPLCSSRPHRTFIPLLPSCRAISQVEMRSLCAHGS